MEVTQLDIMTGAHIIAHQEPLKVISQVEAFQKGKQKFQAIYSTTTIATGQTGAQINFMVVTSCLCLWETTIDEYKSFQSRLQLMNGQLT